VFLSFPDGAVYAMEITSIIPEKENTRITLKNNPYFTLSRTENQGFILLFQIQDLRELFPIGYLEQFQKPLTEKSERG